MRAGLGRQTADLHGKVHGQQLDDDVVRGNELPQAVRIIGIDGGGAYTLRLVGGSLRLEARTKVRYGDRGERLVLQHVMERSLALQAHAEDQQFLG